MADTRPTDNKIRAPRRILLSLLAVAVIAVLAVMTTPKHAPLKYWRYVSPLLPNGSRVTFLYPVPAKQLITVYTDTSITGIYYANTAKPQNQGDQLLWAIPAWRQFRSKNNFTAGFQVYNADEPLPVADDSESGHSGQRLVSVLQVADGDGVDKVDVKDSRSGLEYVFQFARAGTVKNALPTKEETTVTNSFQVLPPGATVPTP